MAPLLPSEVVATAGLVVVDLCLGHDRPRSATPRPRWAVWIGAAYWWTSSTSFANPAVTIGRAFTDTFAGIAPASVAGFVAGSVRRPGGGLALIEILIPVERAAA